MDRRNFILKSSLILAGSQFYGFTSKTDSPVIRFGMVADPHYAEVETSGRSDRFYRQSAEKLKTAITHFNTEQLDFIIELGDFKDQDPKPKKKKTLQYLRDIEKVFTGFNGPRYHVLGNHDMDSISKKDFQENTENTGIPVDKTYYSFDQNGIHMIVLDANYSKAGKNYKRGDFDWMDSNIRPWQMKWLKKDLEYTDKPTFVFIHQRLDTPNTNHKIYCVRNAEKVRRVLEKSGKVVAVFQGHDHEGAYSKINEIHYYTQVAMVSGAFPQNNSFSIVEVFGNGSIRINGYVNCESRDIV